MSGEESGYRSARGCTSDAHRRARLPYPSATAQGAGTAASQTQVVQRVGSVFAEMRVA